MKQVYYNGSQSGVEHKGTRTTGQTDEILLKSGEFIVTVTGRSDLGGNTAGHLEFTSNRGILPLLIPLPTTRTAADGTFRQEMGPVWEGYQR